MFNLMGWKSLSQLLNTTHTRDSVENVKKEPRLKLGGQKGSKNINTCRYSESNRGSSHYECDALPLSHSGCDL